MKYDLEKKNSNWLDNLLTAVFLSLFICNYLLDIL